MKEMKINTADKCHSLLIDRVGDEYEIFVDDIELPFVESIERVQDSNKRSGVSVLRFHGSGIVFECAFKKEKIHSGYGISEKELERLLSSTASKEIGSADEKKSLHFESRAHQVVARKDRNGLRICVDGIRLPWVNALEQNDAHDNVVSITGGGVTLYVRAEDDCMVSKQHVS